ncbi:MAG: DUF6268 family outer membrane beta-barrel protein [Candidatus Polarisedimenticolia bacterium]
MRHREPEEATMHHRSTWFSAAVTAAVLLFVGAPSLRAQTEEIELDLFRPRVELTGETAAAREFQEGTGELEWRALSVNANIPLGSVHADLKGRVLAYQHFLSANFAEVPADIELLNDPDRTLYHGGARFTTMMLGRSKNLYIISAGTTFAEDSETLGSMKQRLSALFAATHRVNPKVMLIYGGAFTYQFGRGTPLPLFGVSWRAGERWTLSGALPFSISARYAATRDLSVRLRLAASGNRYRFENQGEFPGADEVVFLRLVQTQVAGGIEWRASPDVTLMAEAGITRASTVTFTDGDGDTDLLEDSTDPGGYLKVGMRFLFGESLLTRLQDRP